MHSMGAHELVGVGVGRVGVYCVLLLKMEVL